MNMKRNLLAGFLYVISLSIQAGTPDLILLTLYQTDMDINGLLMSEKLDGVV